MSGGAAVTVRLLIVNKRGLHARAAAKFVKLVQEFDALVEVSHQGTTVNGLSIMGLLMLAAPQGSEVEVSARGPEAAAAAAAAAVLVRDGFGER